MGDTKGLFSAAAAGDTAKVAQLLTQGRNLEAKNQYGDTPLVVAARKGHTNTVRFLLDAGANIHTTDDKGYSVLMRAAKFGKTEVVRLLIERGAEVNHTNKRGASALSLAREGYSDIVTLLKQAGAKEYSDPLCQDSFSPCLRWSARRLLSTEQTND